MTIRFVVRIIVVLLLLSEAVLAQNKSDRRNQDIYAKISQNTRGIILLDSILPISISLFGLTEYLEFNKTQVDSLLLAYPFLKSLDSFGRSSEEIGGFWVKLKSSSKNFIENYSDTIDCSNISYEKREKAIKFNRSSKLERQLQVTAVSKPRISKDGNICVFRYEERVNKYEKVAGYFIYFKDDGMWKEFPHYFKIVISS